MKERALEEFPDETKIFCVQITNTFTGDQLMQILLRLRNLKDFIDTNSVFTSSITADRCDIVIVIITTYLYS